MIEVQINSEANYAKYKDYSVVEVFGEVDAYSFDSFQEQLERVISGADKILLDLGGLFYINSAGLGLLLNTRSELESLVLANLQDVVQETLQLLGFLQLFQIEEEIGLGCCRDLFSLTVKASSEELTRVRHQVSDWLEKFPSTPEETYAIVTALDETLSNVLEHSLDFDSSREVQLDFYLYKNGVRIVVTNDGPPFSPGEKSGDIKDYIKENRSRGLGLYIIHSLLDRVEYTMTAAGDQQIRLEKVF